MSSRVALITGITGQDGGFLAQLLLDKGYEVHGMRRRSSSAEDGHDRLGESGLMQRVRLHYGDMTDPASIIRVVRDARADEIYNLAAQSHVKVSFENPAYTAQVNALGCLHLLEAIRLLDMVESTRFYQASTSELYGDADQMPQSETTVFRPRSPYAISKHFALLTTINYREAYDLHASNGILFNHEGKTRGESFVTRKITRAAAAWSGGNRKPLALGNLNARRDWGDARDYVRGMWLLLQQAAPDDYVLATGESRTVRQFVEAAFATIGVKIDWRGDGDGEVGVDARSGDAAVMVDQQFFRPAEVNHLVGDATRARQKLGWRPEISFERMVREMVEADVARLREHAR
jgi:GDPmannose 4,6-dehydratase